MIHSVSAYVNRVLRCEHIFLWETKLVYLHYTIIMLLLIHISIIFYIQFSFSLTLQHGQVSK